MAYPVKHDYKPGALALIRGRVINALSRICSFWACGNYINVHKPECPSGDDPIKWDLDVKAAAPAFAHEFHAQDLWDHNVYPFALFVRLNANKTAVSSVRIFIPSNCARIKDDVWTFDTAKFTAVSGAAGWYTVGSFTTGNLWLVEKSGETHVLTTSTTAPSSGTMGFFVGSVAFASGVATVAQNMCGGLAYGGGLDADNQQRKDMSGVSGWKKQTWDRNTRDTTTWTRGTTKVTVNGKEVNAGVKIFLPTRGVDDGLDAKVQWRECEFDQNGCLVSIDEESTNYGTVTTIEDDE